MFGVYILIFAFTLSLVWLWTGGIEYMRKNNPDYKGEDFLNWDKHKENEKDNVHK